MFCILHREIYALHRALYVFLLQLHTFNFFSNDVSEGINRPSFL